jgi:hypothetical protein
MFWDFKTGRRLHTEQLNGQNTKNKVIISIIFDETWVSAELGSSLYIAIDNCESPGMLDQPRYRDEAGLPDRKASGRLDHM